MKKAFFLLCALLLAVALTACGGETNPMDRSDPAASQPAEAQPAETPSDPEKAPNESGDPETNRILAAYFSATNNTEGIA